MAPPSWYARPDARHGRFDPAPPEVRAFHAGLPGYAPTALTELPSLAAELGVGRVLVKDESARLGLPAFKALGASWAVHQAIVARTGARPPGVGARRQPPGNAIEVEVDRETRDRRPKASFRWLAEHLAAQRAGDTA